MTTQEIVDNVGKSSDRRMPPESHGPASAAGASSDWIVNCQIKKLYYGNFLAVRDAQIPITPHQITAFIGPSGCGKSTVLRSLNRMNDFIPGFRLDGSVHFQGQDIYANDVDPVAVRRSIGMVFQQPNPFAMSIYANVAFGLRLNRFKGNYDERVEMALRGAALWDEVKDKLQSSGLSLSGGQQQRLCIARAIAVEPPLLLMDEPCSALDPIATRRVEDLMLELKERYTIAIVTHNLQQAQRVADRTAFFFVDTSAGGRTGYLIEYRPTGELFNDPHEERTKAYIRGEFS
jgi:phosphate transport system ATP-binding protein